MVKYIAGFKLTQLLISVLGSLYVLFVYKTSTIDLKNRKNIDMLFKKKWVLNTWDKFIIPKPFNQITIIWGEAIPAIKDEKSINQTKNKLESKMEDLTKRANKNN